MTTKTSLITREILNRIKEAGIKTNKTLGQNFLVNKGIYEKIIAAADIKPEDIVLEVGPGLGTLTNHIVQNGARIIAVEKDPKLVNYLQNRFKNNERLEIIRSDILKFKPEDHGLQSKNYKILGNIPYYLTSHLLKIVFESWPEPENVIFIIQKEVAQRIIAKPPKMSLLSVSIQYYSKPQIISYVSRGSFYPAPSVDSAIIKLVPNGQVGNSYFFKVVKAGFASKRKQLGNNLASGLKLPKEQVETMLSSINLDPKRRAETLTIEEWQRTAKLFS